jgi:hypothetical protein
MAPAGRGQCVALAAALCMTGTLARAQGKSAGALDLSIEVGGHYASGSAGLDDRHDLFGATTYIEARAGSGDAVAYVDSQLQIADLADPKIATDHALREAYVDIIGDDYELRLGRQLIIWGRADRFNPTDNLTPRDFNFLTYDAQGQRFGALGATGRYYLNDSISAFAAVLPWFKSSRLPDGLVPGRGGSLAHRKPDDGLGNPQLALKLERAGQAMDGSLSFYRGFATSPALNIGGGSDPAFVNPEIRVYGGDFAAAWRSRGFRGEIAYTDYRGETRFPAGTGPHDNVFAVLGVEHEVLGDSTLLVQGLLRHVFDFVPARSLPGQLRELALANDTIFRQFDETQVGMTASLVSRFRNDTLKTELAGAVYFDSWDFVLRPRLEYAITDEWRLLGVVELFRGPQESNFGSLRKASRLFVELRYGF